MILSGSAASPDGEVRQIVPASFHDPARREEIAERLAGTGRAVIDLSHEQIGELAGNCRAAAGE
jgi:hypothetical protein